MAQSFGESRPPREEILRATLPFLRRAAAAAVFLLLAACASTTPTPAASGRAGLIVGLSDGSFSTACVTLAGTDFSGEDLLRDSGLRVTLDAGNALGTLVCSIADQGCRFPDEACLCRCRGAGPCSYWAYFTWDVEHGWTYAVQGARLRMLQDGDLDAWIWLDRSLPGDELPLPPPDLTFDAVCR
jgi:hypothetical protein